MSKRLALVGAAVLTLASCSSTAGYGGGGASQGGGSSPGGSSPAPTSSVSTGKGVAIAAAHGVLVAPDGKTVYYNTVDTKTKITCTGACAQTWIPVTGTPRSGQGVGQEDLATAARPDGTKQVTYYGHPLYEFSGDAAPGDTKGNGLADAGGKWIVARPGQANGGGATTSKSPSGGNGGGGYYP